MPRTVIIGGGIIGSCTAYFLAGDNDVVVLEKDPTYQYASTTLSASSIRTQFSLPLNVRMSLFGATFLDAVAERIGLVRRAYLVLAGAAGEPKRCAPIAGCRLRRAPMSRCSKELISPTGSPG